MLSCRPESKHDQKVSGHQLLVYTSHRLIRISLLLYVVITNTHDLSLNQGMFRA
jgi:hypothetical protein